MEYFKATDACAVCKGVCCKRMACHYAPEDFKEISFDALKAEIEKGKISIDWWEGDTGRNMKMFFFGLLITLNLKGRANSACKNPFVCLWLFGGLPVRLCACCNRGVLYRTAVGVKRNR